MKPNYKLRFLALVSLLLLATAGLSAQASQGARLWYANGLERLGFTVFDKPQSLGDFTVASLDGSSQSLGRLRGKIVILNFWATWCPPCRDEMPALNGLWKSEKGKPFMIMGVSVGEAAATVKAFISKTGYEYPIYLDPNGALGSRFGVRSIPDTIIFNKDGMAIATKVGGAEYDSAEALELFSQLATR